MYIFTIDKSDYDETQLNKAQISQLIRKHRSFSARIRKNIRYYEADHAIKTRKKKIKGSSNNKVVCNHAKEISDTATGYFIGNAIKYTTSNDQGKEALDKLTDAFDKAEVEDVDNDIALDQSRSGVGYEYVYIKENTTELCSKSIEPTNTFLVKDDTIEQNLLFGVYYFRFKDAITGKYRYKATVCTESYLYEMILEGDYDHTVYADEEPREHFLGGVPIIEYLNNKDGIGDYEQQISLIDAYNTLMSDRVNDKEQFVESLLIIYGAIMGDDNDEVSEAVKILRENGLLELPDSAKAEYISRTFDESGMEVLRKAIKEDIYTFSHVPNLTDENFVGNSSGVAMEYKLLGLEMITKIKERYYKKGLKRRIELYSNYLKLKAISVNPTAITPVFTRALPKNLLELSQMIANFKGTVSNETLISQVPFVDDAQTELEKLNKESEENMKKQQKMFNANNDIPFNKEDEDEENNDQDKKPDTFTSDKTS